MWAAAAPQDAEGAPAEKALAVIAREGNDERDHRDTQYQECVPLPRMKEAKQRPPRKRPMRVTLPRYPKGRHTRFRQPTERFTSPPCLPKGCK